GFDVAAAGRRRAVVWQLRTAGYVPVALDDGGAFDAGLVALDAAPDAGGTFAAAGDVAGAPSWWRVVPASDQAPVANDDVVIRHFTPGGQLVLVVDTEDSVLLNDADADGDLLRVVEAGVALTTTRGATIPFDDGG